MLTKRKIALVKVYFNMFEGIKSKEEKKKNIEVQSQSYPPLGLCYLQAYLNSKGINDVEIIDCVERRYASLLCAEYIVKNNFNIVGVSVTSFLLKEISSLIREIRKRNRGIIIVLGGVHVTHHPEIVKILNADYGIRGDGEESFYNFLINFNHNIDGLVYLEGGVVKYNKSAKIDNLDALPFPTALQHKYKFPIYNGKIYTMITSRGCFYDCIFCGLPHRRDFRERSIGNVFDEIESLCQKGYDYIDFKDDCFSLNRERVVRLCNLIIKSKLKINWGAETRADLVDYDLLKLMREAGCHNLKFGIESGVMRLRNEAIGKALSDEAIFNAIKWCRELQIKKVGYVILGTPTESLMNMKQSIKFISNLGLDYLDVVLAVPIPGSRLFKKALEEKKIEKDIWRRVAEEDCSIPIYVPDGVKLKEMRSLQSRAYKSFYFNPIKILKEISSTNNVGALFSKFRAAYNILTNY